MVNNYSTLRAEPKLRTKGVTSLRLKLPVFCGISCYYTNKGENRVDGSGKVYLESERLCYLIHMYSKSMYSCSVCYLIRLTGIGTVMTQYW